MGKNSSKIMDFIYVTGQDFDPPQFDKKNQKRQQKEVKIDYRKFKPKSFYKLDATDQQIQQHLAKLQKKEKILKQFKYSEDFDRIDYKQMQLQVPTFQILVEQGIKLTAVVAIIGARLYQVQTFNDYFTVAGVYRMFWPLFGFGMCAMIYRFAMSPEYHIVNHEYFRMIPHQIALKQQFQLNLNYYKDVQDIKYNFKYPSVVDYYKTKRDILDRDQLTYKNISKEYYEYIYGLKIDKYEEYLKIRAQQRKTSKDVIGQQELQQITKDLSLNHNQQQN